MSRITAGLLLAVGGCAEEQAPEVTSSVAPIRAPQSPLAPKGDAAPPGGEAQGTPTPAPASAARKIIYSADLTLIVEDFNPIPDKVAGLARESGGYIAEMDLSGSSGAQRRGRWKLRVPIDRFEAFLASATKLGVPERNQRASEDVTDRYYDTESRIKNKKVEEARLIKLLEERTGKLDEVIQVERELSRVRGEIEQLQGSLQLLANLTGLTTITLVVEERKDYVPPQAPTFAATAARTLGDSTEALVNFLKGIALLFLAVLPWIPLVAVLAVFAWLVIRRIVVVRQTPIPIDPRTLR